MKKRKTSIIVFLLSVSLGEIHAQASPTLQPALEPLSFEESLQILATDNQSIKIANKGIQIAQTEKGKLNSFWYPRIQSSGAWVHLSQKIEVKQSLKPFTDPVKDFLHGLMPDAASFSNPHPHPAEGSHSLPNFPQPQHPGTPYAHPTLPDGGLSDLLNPSSWLPQLLAPGEHFASSLLDHIGAQSLAFPLAPPNLASIDLTAEWVLFAGGKRLNATKIGKTMVNIARVNRAQVSANQQVLLAESYYGLQLAQQVVSVRQEVYNGLKKHYEQALKLEACGIIDKAGKLFAQVNMDEAKRALESAQKEEKVVQKALKVLLNRKESDADIFPTSPLFINETLPPKMEYDFTVTGSNYALNLLRLQEHIVLQEKRIARSGYVPNIAVFGKQTIYSHGIQRNLLPRTFIGIGFTWNLFDGLDREKKIRQARLMQQSLVLGEMKIQNDLKVGIDQLYTQLQKAQDDVKALNTTIKLSEELVRIRKKSFTEGMATSLEVIDAENLLAKVKVARLAAYYEFDVALIHLLSLCGIPEQFPHYGIINE